MTFVATLQYNVSVATKGGENMNAKIGRPTDSPKNIMIRVRMDNETVKIMDECAKALNTTRSDIIRKGIRKVYTETKK